jgi:L-threonylcarbamoyladenylate synthase
LAEKPMTIIYSNGRNLAPNLIADDGSIGIRITNEDFSKKLCRQFRKPLVSTSANISGKPFPSNFSEINEEILRSVDYVVNYRRSETKKSEPSGIIQLGKGGLVKIIRK